MVGKWVEISVSDNDMIMVYRVVVTRISDAGIFGPYLAIIDNRIYFKARSEGLWVWNEVKNVRFL